MQFISSVLHLVIIFVGAARLAISTCERFAKEHPQALDEIQFVLHDDRTYLVYDMEIEKLYD